MNDVLKKPDGSIYNPHIPRYEVKYVVCNKSAKADNLYTHGAGGYRVNFGLPKSFANFPTSYCEILTIIPLGCFQSNDGSYAGALSFNKAIEKGVEEDNSVRLWGISANSNDQYTAQILVIYK